MEVGRANALNRSFALASLTFCIVWLKELYLLDQLRTVFLSLHFLRAILRNLGAPKCFESRDQPRKHTNRFQCMSYCEFKLLIPLIELLPLV